MSIINNYLDFSEMHYSIPFSMQVQNLFLFLFFAALVLKIYLNQKNYSKKYQYVTFVVVNFPHHATYRWKALDEQIPNIYTFIGQKPFNFNIKSLIIFGICPEIYPNAPSHDNYQKLFIGISISYMYQSIPFSMYIKKNIFSRFFHVWFPRYSRFIRFFSKKVLICNVCYRQHCASCNISLESS